jgi:hypothetical protein
MLALDVLGSGSLGESGRGGCRKKEKEKRREHDGEIYGSGKVEKEGEETRRTEGELGLDESLLNAPNSLVELVVERLWVAERGTKRGRMDRERVGVNGLYIRKGDWGDKRSERTVKSSIGSRWETMNEQSNFPVSRLEGKEEEEINSMV